MKKRKSSSQHLLYALFKDVLISIKRIIICMLQKLYSLFYIISLRLKICLHKECSYGKKEHKHKPTDQFLGLLDSCRVRLLVLILLLLFPTLIIKAYAKDKQNTRPDIADDIIRFHVIANSDSDEDQALKLEVKNTLVESLSPSLNLACSIDEAREILLNKMSYIKELAQDTISLQGYSYPVNVSLEECYFPLKVYGEYTFPPGYYEALRVEIGEAKGKNWWCVMFPPLCFVDETYSIVDESSGKKLSYLLTEDEYNALKNKKTPVKIRFKLFELIKKAFD